MSNTKYGLKFVMEKNDLKRLKSSSGKKRNDFVVKTQYFKPIRLEFVCTPLLNTTLRKNVRSNLLKLIGLKISC